MKLKNFTTTAALISVLIAGGALGADGQTAVGQQEVTAQQRAIDTSRLSPDLVSLGKLVQSGVGEKVVLTYIQNTAPKRNPTAEELVYLHELGLSSDGMVALMNAVPKVSLTEAAPAPAPIVQPLHVQRGDQSGGTVQSAPPTVVTQTPVQSAPVSGHTVISSPAPIVVYTQPAPTTVYVERPPVVTYVEPYPRYSFGLSLGHHLFGHHFGGHHGGHHGGGHHGGGHHGGGHH